jgi:hypothetical protein
MMFRRFAGPLTEFSKATERSLGNAARSKSPRLPRNISRRDVRPPSGFRCGLVMDQSMTMLMNLVSVLRLVTLL